MTSLKQASKLRLHWFILMASISALLPLDGSAEQAPVTTVTVAGQFEDVRDNIRQAIEGKGINIAHALPASDMLNRTGKDFGIEKNVFLQAETVEFCSARISHLLAQANHENILLCPFTISIYVLTDDPDNVRLSWRRPFTLDDTDSQAAAQEMVELVESIISEATEW